MTKKRGLDCKMKTRPSGSKKAFVPETTRWKVRSGKSLQYWMGAGRKRIASIILAMLMCLSLLLVGCQPDWGVYYGDYPEAFTIASNNLIGENTGLAAFCGVIEKDDYGRTMYYYWNVHVELIADSATKYGSFVRCAVIISQKVENGHVYFYPDYNFISFPLTYEESPLLKEEDFYKTILKAMSEDDLDRLKNLNDWNKSFDEDKCISLEIANESRDHAKFRGLVRRSKIEEYYIKIHPEAVRYVYYVYLTSDNYDRHIYYARGVNEERDYIRPYILLFNFNGSYDLSTGYMEITDFYNYQDALKAFKEQNHWNEPYLSSGLTS